MRPKKCAMSWSLCLEFFVCGRLEEMIVCVVMILLMATRQPEIRQKTPVEGKVVELPFVYRVLAPS